MHKYFYVYILSNKLNTAFYVGMTSDLWRRVEEHKAKGVSAFTSRYEVTKLVYYESFNAPDKALRREDQLKKGSREKRVNAVLRRNPDWTELMPARCAAYGPPSPLSYRDQSATEKVPQKSRYERRRGAPTKAVCVRALVG